MSAKVHVTDHALVRWLERTGAFEIEALRKALRASLERSVSAADAVGSGRYVVVADGLNYVIEGGVLITVTPDTGVAGRARKLRRR